MEAAIYIAFLIMACGAWCAVGRVVAWIEGDEEVRAGAVWVWPVRIPWMTIRLVYALVTGAWQGVQDALEDRGYQRDCDDEEAANQRRKQEYEAWMEAKGLRKGPKAL